jgi:hypothetical protein
MDKTNDKTDSDKTDNDKTERIIIERRIQMITDCAKDAPTFISIEYKPIKNKCLIQ